MVSQHTITFLEQCFSPFCWDFKTFRCYFSISYLFSFSVLKYHIIISPALCKVDLFNCQIYQYPYLALRVKHNYVKGLNQAIFILFFSLQFILSWISGYALALTRALRRQLYYNNLFLQSHLICYLINFPYLQSCGCGLFSFLISANVLGPSFQARMHDESLRYVLSDQAIAALAVSVPKGPTEVSAVIAEADLSTSSTDPSSPSPSPIVVAHVEELCYLLEDTTASMDGIFKSLLEKYKDPSGLCRLSVHNYNLVAQLSLKQTNVFSFVPSGEKLLTAPPNKKASRELFVKKFSCKSPVYHNCRIYASDGRLLCYCDRKKLEWFVSCMCYLSGYKYVTSSSTS